MDIMKTILAEPIKIITPKKYILDGLWFGPARPRRAIIFIHGLSSNAFNDTNFVSPLADKKTAVLTFSNRGHDLVAILRRLAPRTKKGYVGKYAGVSHEVFTESADDLAGAVNLARRRGAKEIYLVGHSTGCQKSIYYLSKKNNQHKVTGVVLLCPISDYASVWVDVTRRKYLRALKEAKKMLSRGKKHELMPNQVWPKVLDVQRWLSLYTPDSTEEIFSYTQKNKRATTFKKVIIPMLVVFAEQDQCSDIPANVLESWFRKNTSSKDYSAAIIPGANHGFYKKVGQLKIVLAKWLK